MLMEDGKSMTLPSEIDQAARALGEAVRENAAAQAHLQAAQRCAADAQAQRIKARLEATYEDLLRRQTAGEVLSTGEIDTYYQLEREVRANPALAQEEQALDQLKDLLTEIHGLLTNELGFSLRDMVS